MSHGDQEDRHVSDAGREFAELKREVIGRAIGRSRPITRSKPLT